MKQNTAQKNGERVVTVGTFDGVHRGHECVLGLVREVAAQRGLQPAVVTFDRHPMRVIRPESAPKLIMDVDRRDDLLRDRGMQVLRVEFTDDVRRLSCEEWMRRLAREHGARVLVLGYDNTFGSDGIEMSEADYREIGSRLGVEVLVAPIVPGCSSSAARRALLEGDMPACAQILGRPFSLRGTVVHGREIGRTIGVPTANIEVPPEQILPAPGVYSAEVLLPDGSRRMAVVNVGSNPTVGDGPDVHVEAHLIDYDADLYGREIVIEFGRRLRDERRFNSLAELREAISVDIAECRATNSPQN